MDANRIYLALDLELNTDGQGPTQEIIEIGVTMAAPSWPEADWVERSWLVRIDRPLYPFITELTGITQEAMNAEAVPLRQAADELSMMWTGIPVEKRYLNPIVWGDGDLRELRRACALDGHEFTALGRRSLDVKALAGFLRLAQGAAKPMGLAKSMEQWGLQFQGGAHRACVDARNTLRLFFHLLNRQATLEGLVSQHQGIG